jgi:hypothetical protein
MDAKITLCFDGTVIEKAKKYADEHNISLSRLIEYLLTKVTDKHSAALEVLPIADWVNSLSGDNITYNYKDKSFNTDEYYTSKIKTFNESALNYVAESLDEYKTVKKAKK